ncbi:MAG: hypothetical protein MJ077_03230 [Oscillospiraceae bacterium]|nr:hypothetical protein [Oscillospiraceae bacterium]
MLAYEHKMFGAEGSGGIGIPQQVLTKMGRIAVPWSILALYLPTRSPNRGGIIPRTVWANMGGEFLNFSGWKSTESEPPISNWDGKAGTVCMSPARRKSGRGHIRDGTIRAKLAKKSGLLEAIIPSRCVLNLHPKVARMLSDSPCESYMKSEENVPTISKDCSYPQKEYFPFLSNLLSYPVYDTFLLNCTL